MQPLGSKVVNKKPENEPAKVGKFNPKGARHRNRDELETTDQGPPVIEGMVTETRIGKDSDLKPRGLTDSIETFSYREHSVEVSPCKYVGLFSPKHTENSEMKIE